MEEILSTVQSEVFGVWFLIGAALVFWMQAGFAMVEAGFTRAKNTGNILMKNLMDFCIGTVMFILIGFGLFLGEDLVGLIGKPGFDIFTDYANFDWSNFVFNLVFCATTATIVSGAMAERTRFLSYCVYSAVISALIYPIEAHWTWGGGWLAQIGFHDFAGSNCIHMVGGALLAERPLSPVQIYCHRGLSSEAPENSLEAIDLAISSLSDGVEIDVQETKDGVVIVCHDSSLKRIAGKKINIADVTYEELKQYDISYYFSKDHEFTYIPTLEEVMSLVKGRAHLLIELKRNSASADLAAKVVGLIEQYEMEYQCSIQSADYAYLRQVNELNPDLTLGYILTTAIGNYYKNDMIDFFCVRSMFVNNTTVAKAHAQGKAVYAWTINTRAEAERMKNAQVDVIITDYPAKAREVIYRDERSSYSIIKLLRLML